MKNFLGFSSVRALQKQVENERKSGKVILSSVSVGYYRAGSAYEIRQFIRTLENRGNKTLAILEGARKLLGELEEAER